MTAAPPRIGYRQIVGDLRTLGLTYGRDVLVHCAMSRLGQIAGGPGTLARAIRRVIGPDAAVVVPTQTANNSTTSRYYRAAVHGMTPEQRRRYDASLPAFHARTPSYRMGTFAEYVRLRPHAVRSTHPQTSFTALGARARTLMAEHDLDCHLGDRSPLGALYRADAAVLLLGTGYDTCTALHLAEYRLPGPLPMLTFRCVVTGSSGREMREFVAPVLDDGPFAQLGTVLDESGRVRIGSVGAGPSRLMEIRPVVDFAVRWMSERRVPIRSGQ